MLVCTMYICQMYREKKSRKNAQNIWWYSHRKNFKSMYDRFSTLRRKTLGYDFQEYFKGIISIILCKTLTLRNLKTLQSHQNLFEFCSKTFW